MLRGDVRLESVGSQEKDDEPEVSGDQTPGNKVDSDGRVQFGAVDELGGGVNVGFDDTTARNKDGCIGQPEYTVGSES